MLTALDGPPALLRNDGSGMFVDVSASSLPLAAQDVWLGAWFADVEADGDPDLLDGPGGR